MLEHAREEAEPKMRRLEGEGRKPEESRSGTTLLVGPALKSHVAFTSHNLVSTLVTFLCIGFYPERVPPASFSAFHSEPRATTFPRENGSSHADHTHVG